MPIWCLEAAELGGRPLAEKGSIMEVLEAKLDRTVGSLIWWGHPAHSREVRTGWCWRCLPTQPLI